MQRHEHWPPLRICSFFLALFKRDIWLNSDVQFLLRLAQLNHILFKCLCNKVNHQVAVAKFSLFLPLVDIHHIGNKCLQMKDVLSSDVQAMFLRKYEHCIYLNKRTVLTWKAACWMILTLTGSGTLSNK